MKRAPPTGTEAAAPVRSLAPPPTNMAQANNARGEGKVQHAACLQLLERVILPTLHVKTAPVFLYGRERNVPIQIAAVRRILCHVQHVTAS